MNEIAENGFMKQRNLSMTSIENFMNAMNSESYSEPTIKSYRLLAQSFLKYHKNTNPGSITDVQIKEYIVYLVEEKRYSVSSQNNAINAIRLFYRFVFNREIEDFFLPRPFRAKTNPKVLNEPEVALILKNVTDLRDKCMIFLVYSAGLSPGEIIYLKPGDIDSVKMRIFISSATGKKDRFVVLAEKVLVLLREYYKEYKPKKWLFESYPNKQYSKRELQRSFRNAVLKSGVSKTANLTILKNSFAVHLIEKGVDIRYIQQMLGHKHSKTTMKYLRVSKRDFKMITSPLDNLEI
jgi:site-specific recombinase XerD